MYTYKYVRIYNVYNACTNNNNIKYLTKLNNNSLKYYHR